MAITDDTFLLNWGSDLRKQFNWPNGAGGNADLTGYALSVIDAHSSISAALTAVIVTLATGLIEIRLDWVDTIPRGRVAFFRLRITSGAGIDASTNALWLDVQ